MVLPISKTGLLAGMSSMAPQVNQQVAQGVGDQAAFAQKQQAGQAYMGGQQLGKPQVAQMGTQLAGQKAGANLAAAQSTLQQQQQIGQVGLQAQQQQAQAQIGEKKLGLQKKQRELENSLESMGEEVKNKLFSQNLAFQKDELGRTAWNERQLADWKVRQAKDIQDLQNYQQQVRQISARKQQLLKTAHAKIVQELQNISANSTLNADMQTKERLMRAKVAMEEKIADEKRAAANRAGMAGAMGTVIGVGAGAATGSPQAAAVGGVIGGGLGTAAAGASGG